MIFTLIIIYLGKKSDFKDIWYLFFLWIILVPILLIILKTVNFKTSFFAFFMLHIYFLIWRSQQSYEVSIFYFTDKKLKLTEIKSLAPHHTAYKFQRQVLNLSPSHSKAHNFSSILSFPIICESTVLGLGNEKLYKTWQLFSRNLVWWRR